MLGHGGLDCHDLGGGEVAGQRLRQHERQAERDARHLPPLGQEAQHLGDSVEEAFDGRGPQPARQPEATQRAMLGPGAYDLYRDGTITLSDLVEIKHDPRWGPTLRRRSLKDLQARTRDGSEPIDSRNRPKNPLRVPLASRHNLRSIGAQSRPKELNTVIEPGVDVAADIMAINAGHAVRQGQDYTINGRVYREKGDGGVFPVSGTGFHQIDRGTFVALKTYNTKGLTEEAERFLIKAEISEEQRNMAKELWKIGRGNDS